jgi:hypothetical protein
LVESFEIKSLDLNRRTQQRTAAEKDGGGKKCLN